MPRTTYFLLTGLPMKNIAWLVLLSLTALRPASAQIDTLQPDFEQLYQAAREKAVAGDRAEARRICEFILRNNSTYFDARVLLGRTYAWEGNRVRARQEIKVVLKADPTYKDAIDALIDVELWDKKPVEALTVVNRGLSIYPTDLNLLMRKASVLKDLERDEEALSVLDRAEELYPSNRDLVSLRRRLKVRFIDNAIAVNYAVDVFSGVYDPMHYAFVQLQRRTSWGTVFGRYNFAERFHGRGGQPEIEFYPRIVDGLYGYLEYGYSTSELFPKQRWGVELFGRLPARFEGSLGARALYYIDRTRIAIYTGSMSLYYRNFWFSARPYFVPNNGGVSKSFTLTARRYFSSSEDYLSMRAGAGFTPDERSIQSSAGLQGTEVFYLQSQTAGIGWQQSFSSNYLFITTFDYTRQELSFSPGSFVSMYSLSVGIRMKF